MKNTLLKILSAFLVLLTTWFIQANAHLADALPALTQGQFSTVDNPTALEQQGDLDMLHASQFRSNERMDIDLFEDETEEERHRLSRKSMIQILAFAVIVSTIILGYLFNLVKRVHAPGQHLNFSPATSRNILYQVYRL